MGGMSTRQITNHDLAEHLERLEGQVDYLRRNLVDSKDYETLTLNEARKEARCRSSTIQDAVTDGTLPARVTGRNNNGSKRWEIRRGDLKAWILKRRAATTY